METNNIINTVVKASSPKILPVSNKVDSDIELSKNGNSLPEDVRANEATKQQRIQNSVSNVNDFVQSIQRDIQFTVHEGTGRSIISVTDNVTGEEIRQFPSAEVLAIAEFIAETKTEPSEIPKGLVFNQSA